VVVSDWFNGDLGHFSVQAITPDFAGASGHLPPLRNVAMANFSLVFRLERVAKYFMLSRSHHRD
jgi:hypothetical protein